MENLVILIIVVVGISCYIMFSNPNNANRVNKAKLRLGKLFYSNNKNSYPTAREVFQILDEAKIKSSFLEDSHE